jgi:hypothetical protein
MSDTHTARKKDYQKCVSHRDFYKHYIIALSSGQKELELGLNPSSFSFIKSIFASTFTIP